MRRTFAFFLLIAVAWAADTKAPSIVDSGSFAVLLQGRRVATENFTMQQSGSGNSVSSKLNFDNGRTTAQQQSELEIAGDGSLRKYVWQEIQPGKAKVTAEPQDKTFIVVKQTQSDTDAGKDSTHPLDVTVTSIVDDNFYSHVQVLLWRYMAMSCSQQSGCREMKLPVFVPHQQMAQLFTVNFVGNDTLRLKHGSVQAGKFRVQTEGGEMHVWMDGVRMVRLAMPTSQVEVVRE